MTRSGVRAVVFDLDAPGQSGRQQRSDQSPDPRPDDRGRQQQTPAESGDTPSSAEPSEGESANQAASADNIGGRHRAPEHPHGWLVSVDPAQAGSGHNVFCGIRCKHRGRALRN